MTSRRGVLLFGAKHTRKAEVGALLAQRLGLRFISLRQDSGRWMKELGFQSEAIAEHYAAGGYEAVIAYFMPFRAQVLARALATYDGAVVTLARFHTVYSPAQLANIAPRVRAFGPAIWLKPAPDMATSVAILEERAWEPYHGLAWDEYFVRHPATASLARATFYTHDVSPEVTCRAIVAQLDAADETIILMGPPGAGKSTQGHLLATHLNRPQASMDGLRFRYYAEIGYDPDEERRLSETAGFAAVLDYWSRFDTHAVQRVLAEYPGHIIDFGAGQTVHEDPAALEQTRRLLAPHPNRFHLLPHPDLDTSVRLTRQRMRARTRLEGQDLLPYLLTHPSNVALADFVAYTEGKTGAEICEEIVATLL